LVEVFVIPDEEVSDQQWPSGNLDMIDSNRFRLALLVVTLGNWVMGLPQLSHALAAQATPRPRVAEGDTFTYLNLFDNGLFGYQDGTFGGWAGNGLINATSQSNGTAARAPAQGPNFTPAAQNGFANRMKWSVTPKRADANHEPRVMIRGNLRISARPGETIRLQGVASDPDGNKVVVKWWHQPPSPYRQNSAFY
jgi:hypothetical protein